MFGSGRRKNPPFRGGRRPGICRLSGICVLLCSVSVNGKVVAPSLCPLVWSTVTILSTEEDDCSDEDGGGSNSLVDICLDSGGEWCGGLTWMFGRGRRKNPDFAGVRRKSGSVPFPESFVFSGTSVAALLSSTSSSSLPAELNSCDLGRDEGDGGTGSVSDDGAAVDETCDSEEDEDEGDDDAKA